MYESCDSATKEVFIEEKTVINNFWRWLKIEKKINFFIVRKFLLLLNFFSFLLQNHIVWTKNVVEFFARMFAWNPFFTDSFWQTNNFAEQNIYIYEIKFSKGILFDKVCLYIKKGIGRTNIDIFKIAVCLFFIVYFSSFYQSDKRIFCLIIFYFWSYKN